MTEYSCCPTLNNSAIVPIAVAGGRANCRSSTYWYNGSCGKNPKWLADFTTTIPTQGTAIYLTRIIAIIAEGAKIDFRIPFVRFAPRTRILHGIVPCLFQDSVKSELNEIDG